MKCFQIPLFLALLLAQGTHLSAADPGWWVARGVINAASPSNTSPATIGQAKHIVSKALVELQARLPAAQYSLLQAEVAAVVNLALPVTPAEFEKQRAVLLVGQVKALAKPFYDRLRIVDPAWLNLKMNELDIRQVDIDWPPTYSPYPWSVDTADDLNRAVGTVGQLKAVFSLPFETLQVASQDYIPLPAGLVDTDHDGISDVTEAAIGTSPLLADSDSDGYPDGSDAAPLDPSRWLPNPIVAGDSSPPLVTLRSPAYLIYVAGP
jgi:hypothetical protein